MAFHVFVEGATDATPSGVARLAEAIAKHYGMPAADLHARLQKGRFRVKGNTDRETAEKYKRDLEILGARCVIEEATVQNSGKATPLPFPAVRPATPVAGTPLLPPKPSGQSAKPATPPSGTPQYQSGLSAAFSGETPAANLGALAGDGLSFALSSVDGADDQAKGDTSFAPRDAETALPASIGPAPEKPKPKAKEAKPEKPKDTPLDMFAPPDQQGEELKVDIASDEQEHTAKKRAATPVPDDSPRTSSDKLPRPQSEPAARKSQPSLQQPSEPAAVVKASKLGPLADPRARFAAGVLLAVVIGFVPAHLVASMKEKSAYKAIDDKVIAAQQLADTPEAYSALDRLRSNQLDRKKSEQRNAAIIALAIWALVGGGIAFAWFKKVPWDNFD